MAPAKKIKRAVRSKLRTIKSPIKTKFPAKAIRKANKTRKRSSIELLVYKWMEEEGIVFRKEKTIGRCHVDVFIEPNKVLEIQGCYWHRNVCCYPEKTKENLEVRMKDVRRFAFFRNSGYEVHTFTECEIKDNPEYVKQRLRDISQEV